MPTQDDFLNTLESWAGVYLFHSLTDFFNYLKHTDLSMLQAYALTYLYYNGPSKISDLCEHMLVSTAATSQLVDRLEKQNLVSRVIDPQDRRVRKVILTTSGETFVAKGIEARQSWLKDIPPRMSSEQLAQVTASLKALIALSMEGDEELGRVS